MAALTESTRTGQFLVSDAPGTLSRETVTVDVPAGTALEVGTVLGCLSGTGHYAPYDNRNSDGTETAVGVLYARQVNDGIAPASVKAVIIDCLAEVNADLLVWSDGVDEAGGLADLAAKFIKARD
jgi:Bacteriophage lambda head decoration protein D